MCATHKLTVFENYAARRIPISLGYPVMICYLFFLLDYNWSIQGYNATKVIPFVFNENDIDDLVQDCCISITSALTIISQSCIVLS